MDREARIEPVEAAGKRERPAQPLSAAPTIVDPALAALFNSSVNPLYPLRADILLSFLTDNL